VDPERAAALMRRALRLAARGRGRVEPNPMVGCVLARGGAVLAEGYHRRFGGPHAEIEALRRCAGAARGATAFVTLEPCCYTGKTPPCTRALIAAGVARVVAAMRDPNPRVRGRGLRELSAAGIDVAVGLLEGEAQALNAPFSKTMRERRPWVIAKWAQSLDGRIATRRGDSKWISDETARAHAQRVRGRVDAIVVGATTVLRDDPLLTCRVGRPRRVATRVVLDSRLRIPAASRLVRSADRVPTWICCGPAAPRSRERALTRAGCVVKRLPLAGGVSLEALLDACGAADFTNVLVEGGGAVLGAFLDCRLIDEAHVYVAPRLIGGQDAVPCVAGVGCERVARSARLVAPTWKRLGDGWLVQGRLRQVGSNGARRAR